MMMMMMPMAVMISRNGGGGGIQNPFSFECPIVGGFVRLVGVSRGEYPLRLVVVVVVLAVDEDRFTPNPKRWA